MTTLDPKVLADLERAARGVGRKATFAHPDCTCIDPETKSFVGHEHCPQHGPGHRRPKRTDETTELFDAVPVETFLAGAA